MWDHQSSPSSLQTNAAVELRYHLKDVQEEVSSEGIYRISTTWAMTADHACIEIEHQSALYEWAVLLMPFPVRKLHLLRRGLSLPALITGLSS